MSKSRKIFAISFLAFLVLTALVFKPQIKSFYDRQFILWSIDRVNSERVVNSCRVRFCIVTAYSNRGNFTFYYLGSNDISEKVDLLNSVMEEWPNSKSRCEAMFSTDGAKHCLVSGQAIFQAPSE